MSAIFDFEWVSKMPIILHHHNIDGIDELEAYRKTDEGKKLKKAGDDRVPPWTWHYHLYHQNGVIVIPEDNISSALLYGGQKTAVIGAARGNYQALTQSGLLLLDESCPLLVHGKPVAMKEIEKLRDLSFYDQTLAVAKLGFQLYKKPVAVGKAKHIRIRPMFKTWALKGRIQIVDPIITEDALRKIMENTGRLAGLGDRRPGVEYPKKPGKFGTFTVKLKKA